MTSRDNILRLRRKTGPFAFGIGRHERIGRDRDLIGLADFLREVRLGSYRLAPRSRKSAGRGGSKMRGALSPKARWSGEAWPSGTCARPAQAASDGSAGANRDWRNDTCAATHRRASLTASQTVSHFHVAVVEKILYRRFVSCCSRKSGGVRPREDEEKQTRSPISAATKKGLRLRKMSQP